MLCISPNRRVNKCCNYGISAVAVEYDYGYGSDDCCDFGTGTYVIGYDEPSPTLTNGGFLPYTNSLDGSPDRPLAVGCGASWEVEYAACSGSIVEGFDAGPYSYSKRTITVLAITIPIGVRIYVERRTFGVTGVQAGWVDWDCRLNTYSTYASYVKWLSGSPFPSLRCSPPVITVVS